MQVGWNQSGSNADPNPEDDPGDQQNPEVWCEPGGNGPDEEDDGSPDQQFPPTILIQEFTSG